MQLNLKQSMAGAREALLDIFFPKQCFGCRTVLPRSETHVLCKTCLNAITLHTLFFCPDCGKRLTECTRLCGCGASFIAAAPCLYGSAPLTEIVQTLKYKGIRDGAWTLGGILAHWARESAFDPSSFCVIPIPLSKRRLRKRGFNQAELIARSFLKHLDTDTLKIKTNILVRTRNTTPQTELHSYAERAENVINAFNVVNVLDVKHKTILLIDDVMTSGSTMREAVKVLRENGAKRVIGLTVLRA
jgi:ComF family protein